MEKILSWVNGWLNGFIKDNFWQALLVAAIACVIVALVCLIIRFISRYVACIIQGAAWICIFLYIWNVSVYNRTAWIVFAILSLLITVFNFDHIVKSGRITKKKKQEGEIKKG